MAVSSSSSDIYAAGTDCSSGTEGLTGADTPAQEAPTSHHFPLVSVFLMSSREARRGSVARSWRVLRVPRSFFMRIVCSVVTAEAAVEDFRRLFLRLVRVSIMNLVRTLSLSWPPALAMAGWRRRTRDLRAVGSSLRS